MNYWITTHWPSRVNVKDKFLDKGAWVTEENRSVLNDMHPGDMIFIYESESGKTIIEKTSDGHEHQVRCKPGNCGVIALAKVTSLPVEQKDKKREYYTDDTFKDWRYRAKVYVINSNGFAIPTSDRTRPIYQINSAHY